MSIEHVTETTCPRCLMPYAIHEGDEVTTVCPNILKKMETVPSWPPVSLHQGRREVSDDIERAARRAERRIKAVSLQHHAHEDSAVLLHALLVDVPAAIEEEFMALRSALLARLARVEEALRFYADEGTYCLSHPAHGGYECCGGGDEGPIIEDRGSKARAALAKRKGVAP